MKSLSTIPGFPPLIAGFGILASWEAAARLLDIHGLVPASEALAQLPVILTDPQALADIAASIRPRHSSRANYGPQPDRC